MIRMNYFKTTIALLSLGWLIGCEDKTATIEPQEKTPSVVNETQSSPVAPAIEQNEPAEKPEAVTESNRDINFSLPSATFTPEAAPKQPTTAAELQTQAASQSEIKPIVSTQQTIIYLSTDANQQVTYSFKTSPNRQVIEVIKPQLPTEHHYSVPGYAVSYGIVEETPTNTQNTQAVEQHIEQIVEP